MSEEIDELLRAAADEDYNDARVELVERAIRIADATRNEVDGWRARLELISSATFAGYPEKAMVAFTACVTKCDAEPEQYSERALLWPFKWINLQAPEYPQFSRAQIDGLLDDMERRYTKHGVSLRPVYMQRMRTARDLGDPEEVARQWYQKWQWAPRDYYADCHACEVNSQASYHLSRGELQEAKRVAARLLSKELSCAEVPDSTYAEFLLPLHDAGEEELAARYHALGYELCKGERDYIVELAQHLEYEALFGDLERAKEMFERHIRWAHENRILFRRFRFVAASAFLFRQMASAGHEDVEVRLPRTIARGPGTYRADELSALFTRDAESIATRFDARNGNDYVSRCLVAFPRRP